MINRRVDLATCLSAKALAKNIIILRLIASRISQCAEESSQAKKSS